MANGVTVVQKSETDLGKKLPIYRALNTSDLSAMHAEAQSFHDVTSQETFFLPPVPTERVPCNLPGKLKGKSDIDQTLSKYGLVPWSATVPNQLMGNYSTCLSDVDDVLMKESQTTSTEVPYPLVAKPVYGDKGHGVHTGLNNAEMLCTGVVSCCTRNCTTFR